MANLSFKVNSVSAYDNMANNKIDGTLYFATDSHSIYGDRAYIYCQNGTKTYNIVPRLLGVPNGGTGNTTFITNGVIYGQGTSALAATAAPSVTGQLLAADSNKIPAFGTPSFSWDRTTASNLWLDFTIHNAKYSSANIPSATYQLPGIVTATDQMFGGMKTFGNGLKIAAANTTSDCATFTYNASTDTLIIDFPN